MIFKVSIKIVLVFGIFVTAFYSAIAQDTLRYSNSNVSQDTLISTNLNIIEKNTFAGFKWQEGEDLQYRVDWSFVYLGDIYLKHLGKEMVNGIEANHVRVIIESNPLLFWLDHESVYDSYMTDSMKIIRFVSDEKIDGEEYNATYDFDYNTNKINLTLIDLENPDSTKYKSLDLEPNIVDGISLIYYSRINSMKVHNDTVTTFIEDKSGDVVFNFTLENEQAEISELPDSVDTVHFTGQLFVKGIAGVTGPFEAWFSNDAYRVPVLAYMDVFVGRVKIELENWKYWVPQPVVTAFD